MYQILSQFFADYWPHVLALLSVALATPAVIHAAMTKDDVRAAIGWVGVVLLSPVLGSLIYLAAGVNRMRRGALSADRRASVQAAELEAGNIAAQEVVAERFGRRFAALHGLGDKVAGLPLTSGNQLDLLESGDQAYRAMLAAIDGAKRSVLIESYIFDRDQIGARFAESLAAAQSRGVEVRVLIDAVGVRYSLPAVTRGLRAAGVRCALFNGRMIAGLRLPYANLRTHRKLLITDGEIAFAGGINIRESFSQEIHGDEFAHDTHFRLTGPVVAELFAIAAEDWHFASDERLSGPPWAIVHTAAAPARPMLMRAVASGPDARLETSHKLLTGAFSVARRSIRIMSPYFLPDRELISALNTAARRGVEVDIVVPGANNLKFVDRAMTAQFDQLLKDGCRIWRSNGPFNHSKLMSIDHTWVFAGSSNMDPRSLRLNFEVDLEIYDAGFAGRIAARIDHEIAGASAVTLAGLRNRRFLTRLTDRVVWLASPYL